MQKDTFLRLFAALLFTAFAAPSAMANPCSAHNPCGAHANPCDAKANPCGGAMANPCGGAMANPCGGAMANPCGGAMANPCGGAMANPCGGAMANPCGGAGMPPVDPSLFRMPAGTTLAKGKAKKGAKLWADRSLSGDGSTACSTCHTPLNGGPYNMIKPGFAKPYPHPVEMAKARANVSAVNAAEMVNFCMVVPMKAKPLAWDGKDLANLAAYVESIRSDFKPAAGAMANPCGGKPMNACNPCGGM